MRPPSATPCHACDTPATHHWQREATDEESTDYHARVDAWRVSEGLGPIPDDAAIRTAPVMIPVFGCCEHRPAEHAACGDCPGQRE